MRELALYNRVFPGNATMGERCWRRTSIVSPETKIILSVSGGKDSTMAWALCETLFTNEIIPVFANTGHESEVTYAYLEYLSVRFRSRLRYVERKVEDWGETDWRETTLDDLKRDVMQRLGQKKGCFPRTMAKWCTTILKIEPIRWWFNTLPPGSYLLVTGLRGEESSRRAKMVPYVEQDPLYGCPRWHCIFDWTEEEVFKYLELLDVKPNPLYEQGFNRVGCFPCIYARKSEIRNIADNFPADIDRVRAMEEAANFTFFHYDKVPPRFRENGQAPIDRVVAWSRWNRGEPDPPEISIADGEDLEGMSCDTYGFCQ